MALPGETCEYKKVHDRRLGPATRFVTVPYAAGAILRALVGNSVDPFQYTFPFVTFSDSVCASASPLANHTNRAESTAADRAEAAKKREAEAQAAKDKREAEKAEKEKEKAEEVSCASVLF